MASIDVSVPSMYTTPGSHQLGNQNVPVEVIVQWLVTNSGEAAGQASLFVQPRLNMISGRGATTISAGDTVTLRATYTVTNTNINTLVAAIIDGDGELVESHEFYLRPQVPQPDLQAGQISISVG